MQEIYILLIQWLSSCYDLAVAVTISIKATSMKTTNKGLERSGCSFKRARCASFVTNTVLRLLGSGVEAGAEVPEPVTCFRNSLGPHPTLY